MPRLQGRKGAAVRSHMSICSRLARASASPENNPLRGQLLFVLVPGVCCGFKKLAGWLGLSWKGCGICGGIVKFSTVASVGAFLAWLVMPVTFS